MLNETQLNELLMQYREGTLDQARLDLLEGWADETEANRDLLELLTPGSPLTGELKEFCAYDQMRVWTNIRREAQQRRRRGVFRIAIRTVAAAAVVAALVVGGEMTYKRYSQPQGIVSVIQPGRTMAILELSSGEQIQLTDKAATSITEADQTEISIDSATLTFRQTAQTASAKPIFNTITVPKGCEYQIELSDGTKVWINAESQLIIPTQFAADARRVELRGEAYFEVKSNPKHPFIVKTEKLDVEVLGTSFNVMSYADEPTIETTLITGSVRIHQADREVLLQPGMQAQFDREDQTMTLRDVYAESYAAWSKNMFVFFNEPIASICRKLSRWYGVEIDASSKRLRGIYYSGMIRRTETLNSIAELLSTTDELIFSEVDGRMIVDRK